MLSVVTCDCGSSEQLVRQHLHKYEYSRWATEPILKGKTKSLAEVERLIRIYPDDPDLRALFSFINNTGKWCVFIGYDNDGNVRWSDISHNDMKSDVEAEAIVANFS